MNTAAATAGFSGRSFKEVWVISLGHALTHWYPATFYLLLPIIGRELGLSYAEIGFIMTVQHTVGAITNIPGGVIVDAVGYKGRLMAISLFWIGFPYLLMAFTNAYWMLLGCVALIGIGNNLWHPAAISTLGQRFPQRKGLALSFHGMGGNFGEALAPLIIGALLAVYSWRTVVVVNLLPGVVMATALLLYLGSLHLDARGGGVAKSAKPWTFADYIGQVKSLFSSRPLVIIAASSFFRSGAQSALMTFLPVYLANKLGYSPATIGLTLFILQASAFASAPIAGHMSDKLGRKSVMTGAMTMSAVVLAAMALVGDSIWFVFLVSLAGFFMYATRPVIQAWSLEIAPATMGGTVVGIMFGVQAVGAAMSPVAGGLIADAFDLSMIFYFLAVIIVIASVLVMFVPDTKSTAAPARAA